MTPPRAAMFAAAHAPSGAFASLTASARSPRGAGGGVRPWRVIAPWRRPSLVLAAASDETRGAPEPRVARSRPARAGGPTKPDKMSRSARSLIASLEARRARRETPPGGDPAPSGAPSTSSSSDPDSDALADADPERGAARTRSNAARARGGHDRGRKSKRPPAKPPPPSPRRAASPSAPDLAGRRAGRRRSSAPRRRLVEGRPIERATRGRAADASRARRVRAPRERPRAPHGVRGGRAERGDSAASARGGDGAAARGRRRRGGASRRRRRRRRSGSGRRGRRRPLDVVRSRRRLLQRFREAHRIGVAAGPRLVVFARPPPRFHLAGVALRVGARDGVRFRRFASRRRASRGIRSARLRLEELGVRSPGGLQDPRDARDGG